MRNRENVYTAQLLIGGAWKTVAVGSLGFVADCLGCVPTTVYGYAGCNSRDWVRVRSRRKELVVSGAGGRWCGTVAEVAKRTGVSRSHVYWAVENGGTVRGLRVEWETMPRWRLPNSAELVEVAAARGRDPFSASSVDAAEWDVVYDRGRIVAGKAGDGSEKEEDGDGEEA